VVVADRAAANALAELYPGANLITLPFADLIPQMGKAGRKRVRGCDAERNSAYRDRRKADLLAQLDQINMIRCETNLPYTYKANLFRPDGGFGGSVFTDVFSRLALGHAGDVAIPDFIAWLRGMHDWSAAKDDAFLWSPAEFDPNKVPRYLPRARQHHRDPGCLAGQRRGDLTPCEFPAMFPT
jgi:hypothetical protein